MRLIIYLASQDTVALFNSATLNTARAQSGQFNRRNLQLSKMLIEENAHDHTFHLKVINPPNSNILANLTSVDRADTKIEIIAHGEGGYRLKSLTATVPPHVYDISPEMLKDFFDLNAFDMNNSQYKFSSLTLFCCEGYIFGKELSKLLPDIEITCFNEDIRIDANGHAYPYRKENEKVVGVGKDGQSVEDHSQDHYRCPLHIFHGRENIEKTIYDSMEAIPTHMQHLPHALLATNSVEIVGNFFELNHISRGNIYSSATALSSTPAEPELPDFDINLLHIENKPDEEPLENESQIPRRRS